ncbi:MAG: helix-turn-helix domain-containing protein [Halobacteria archaeon]|nr:helix-turn-helix domain-containing protein [Halobacteria archaeon]
MSFDKSDAVDALERLGLSKYEAEVFIALQKLGTGTARDIHRITDVPRSQVYGAADGLEEIGLVEIRQSKPIQYRPVDLEEAKSRLKERIEREQNLAFEYLEDVREKHSRGEEHHEVVWTVHGRNTVSDRVKNLIGGANDRVIFGSTEVSLVNDDIRDALSEKADEGIDVMVVSKDDEVAEYFEDEDRIVFVDPPEEYDLDDYEGRVLVVDRNKILISVLGEEELPGINQETAIWSSNTGFAMVQVQIMEGWIENILRRRSD